MSEEEEKKGFVGVGGSDLCVMVVEVFIERESDKKDVAVVCGCACAVAVVAPCN